MTFNNYPEPDPAWDYSPLWHLLQNSKAELDALLSYIATVEDATNESDRQIKERLDQIGQQLNQGRRLLDD